MDLRGASAEWASKDKSSKKHVIEVLKLSLSVCRPFWSLVNIEVEMSPQLKTRQGTELLIQSEIDSVITDWYRALAETINLHVRTFFKETFEDPGLACDDDDDDDDYDDDDVSLRPGSPMRPLRKTCPSLLVLKNRTRRKSSGIPKRPEVRESRALLVGAHEIS